MSNGIVVCRPYKLKEERKTQLHEYLKVAGIQLELIQSFVPALETAIVRVSCDE